MSRRKILTGLLIVLVLAVAIPFLLVLADEEGWGWSDDSDSTGYETWDDPENYLDEDEDYENSGYQEYEEEEESLSPEDEPGLPEEYQYDQMDGEGAEQPQRSYGRNSKDRPGQQRNESLDSGWQPIESDINNGTDEFVPENDGGLEENEEEYDLYDEYGADAEYEGEDELY
ncbi:hypothetical protein M3P05_04930 [Sansalvadorimonas sp. 2012CJ34-2]|uniref:Uncharacterized protein n=1 Tax=Parendozoicomonas callyspongiae TaxID=2942213 RepID=A0ABT0PD42_9GAMM|nr:hypothetical protein [Sansalvadorimonas sp. 2012CJ34-2]MCL6269289.1 hypothetical protein [Sansalvadorimonas sp. 2012CJ34-2]